MARLRLATVWLGGCSGCHMSFLDLDEFLFDVAAAVEVVYSPLVDTKEYPPNVDLCLVEGGVANEENLAMVQRVRKNTRALVSFGDCAITGNVTAMRNPLGAPDIVLERAYIQNAAVGPQIPRDHRVLPALLPQVLPVHAVVPVEFFLPGCPPPADRIRSLVADLLAGKTPNPAPADLKFG